MRVRAIVWREEDMYVAREVATGVTSQGKTVEEAIENLREALELYLEEVPEALEKLEQLDRGIVGVLEVEAKAPKAIRA
ncbi:MAG: type II toxin-antitoxin system HicB family antitoxin [Desulfurococcales archaeon]|nr:type II toxin-antitoxin system HicB family antitoxin [Desulfurococcales archaeon]MCE4626365.1 type II toxin-antitoxin system HicB family antitoxin [Desulfurococcales archaeon]